MVEQSATSIAAFTALAALLATLLVLPPALLLGWVLARIDFPGKSLLETVLALPLVLPPVATGLLLLQTLGRRSPIGRALDSLGIEVVFTWRAVVLAMTVMSFPLVVVTIRGAFAGLDRRYEQMASTLGAGPLRILLTISLPMIAGSIAASALLGFARALGEFGATMMIAGGIPGQTQTLATGIYNLAEAGRERDVNALLLWSFGLAFAAMLLSNRLLRARPRG